MSKTLSNARSRGMTLNELYDVARSHATGRSACGGGDAVGLASLRAGAGWTAQAGSTLQRGVDLTADCAGQIGGDDDSARHRGVGALARGVAAEGVARDAEEVSVRGDLQHCLTSGRCRAGERGRDAGEIGRASWRGRG